MSAKHQTQFSSNRATNGASGARALPALIAAVALLATLPSAAAAQPVDFTLDTASFFGQGSGAARGPNVAKFPANTSIAVDVAQGPSANEYLLTFNGVQFPDIVDAGNGQRFELTVLTDGGLGPDNTFTLLYDANTGAINEPFDTTDSIELEIQARVIQTGQPAGDPDVVNVEFTTDETLLVGCIQGAQQDAEAMRYDPLTDELVIAAALCAGGGAPPPAYWLKLGGTMNPPLPAPEPASASLAAMSLGTLVAIRRRRLARA